MTNERTLNQQDVTDCIRDYFAESGKRALEITLNVTRGGTDSGEYVPPTISAKVILAEEPIRPRTVRTGAQQAEGARDAGAVADMSAKLGPPRAADPLRLHDFSERGAADGNCSICGRSLQVGNHFREPPPGWEPASAERPRPGPAPEPRPAPGELVGLRLEASTWFELACTNESRYRMTIERDGADARGRHSVWIGPRGIAGEVLTAVENLFVTIRRSAGSTVPASDPANVTETPEQHRVRLLAIQQGKPWSCTCGFQNAGIRRTCGNCGWAPKLPLYASPAQVMRDAKVMADNPLECLRDDGNPDDEMARRAEHDNESPSTQDDSLDFWSAIDERGKGEAGTPSPEDGKR